MGIRFSPGCECCNELGYIGYCKAISGIPIIETEIEIGYPPNFVTPVLTVIGNGLTTALVSSDNLRVHANDPAAIFTPNNLGLPFNPNSTSVIDYSGELPPPIVPGGAFTFPADVFIVLSISSFISNAILEFGLYIVKGSNSPWTILGFDKKQVTYTGGPSAPQQNFHIDINGVVTTI